MSTLVAAARPGAARLRRRDTGAHGAVLAAVLVAAAVAASFVGGAGVVQIAYPAGAVLVALTLLLRAQWYSYISFTLLVWFLSHEVRRIADWQTTYDEVSPLTATGAAVSIVALPWALLARRRAYRDVATLFSLALVVLGYGFLVGVVRNGPAPAVADMLTLLGPVVTGLFVLTVPDDDARVRRLLQGVALWGTLLLASYAIVQFLVLPPWDEAWIVDSQIESIGNAAPGEFRAFSTLSTTGPLGQVLAALLLVLVAERRTARQLPVAVIGLVALGITQVRAGWIGLAVGTLALIWLGRTQAWRIVAVVGVLLAALVAAGGPIYESVSTRATETAEAGTEDKSFSMRVAFQAEIAPEVLSDPIGAGMGSTGRATEVSASDLSNERFRNFDSGLFENLTRYGALAGLALLGTLIYTTARILSRARARSLLDAACAAGVLALTVGLVFTDTTRAVYGVVLWTLVGVQGRSWARPLRPAPGADVQAPPAPVST